MKNSVTINGLGKISFTYNGQKYDAAKSQEWPYRWTVSYQGEIQAVSSDLGRAIQQVCADQDQLAALLPTVATGIVGLTVPGI